jgi:hypothetical protein
MMSSAKARPENAELERRVKRRLQRLQRKRWPPNCVVPSFVTLSELHRGHTIDTSSCTQPTRPHSPAREPFAKRKQSVTDLQTFMADNLPYVFLWFPQEIDVINATLQGVPDLNLRDAMHYVREWWLEK